MDLRHAVKHVRELDAERRDEEMQLQESLLEQIVKMEPLEFAGLAKLLGVKVMEE